MSRRDRIVHMEVCGSFWIRGLCVPHRPHIVDSPISPPFGWSHTDPRVSSSPFNPAFDYAKGDCGDYLPAEGVIGRTDEEATRRGL